MNAIYRWKYNTRWAVYWSVRDISIGVPGDRLLFAVRAIGKPDTTY
jgi:hypothetical protein